MTSTFLCLPLVSNIVSTMHIKINLENSTFSIHSTSLYAIELMRELKTVLDRQDSLHQRRQLQNKDDLMSSPMRLIQAMEPQGSGGPKIYADEQNCLPAERGPFRPVREML